MVQLSGVRTLSDVVRVAREVVIMVGVGLLNETYLFDLMTVALYQSAASIDNTQLSLYTWVIKEKWATLTIHIFNCIQSHSIFNCINASDSRPGSGFEFSLLEFSCSSNRAEIRDLIS
jgi:hypothetical protein